MMGKAQTLRESQVKNQSAVLKSVRQKNYLLREQEKNPQTRKSPESRWTPQQWNVDSFTQLAWGETNRLTIWWVDKPIERSGESVSGVGVAFLPANSQSQLATKQLRVVMTHGSSPMTQCSTFPVLILWNHAPSQFSCSEHSWLGY